MSIDPRAISNLSEGDQQLFSQFGVGTPNAAPFECLHHAFEHHVLVQPNAIAVEHLSESLTYADLDSRANRLAHRLRTLGIVPGMRVCLLVQRSIHMVIGILAILKAGGQVRGFSLPFACR